MLKLFGDVMSRYAASQQAKAEMQATRAAHGLQPEPKRPIPTGILACAVKAIMTDALTMSVIIAIGLIYAALT